MSVRPNQYQPNGDVAVTLLEHLKSFQAEALKRPHSGKQEIGDAPGDEVVEFVFQDGLVAGRDIGPSHDTAAMFFVELYFHKYYSCVWLYVLIDRY